MIQRIQTLYLLCAVIVLVVAMMLPIGKFLVGDEELTITTLMVTQSGGVKEMGSWPLAVLAVAATLLPFITIFLYKRRMLQMRLCLSEFVLLIGLQGFIIWVLSLGKDTLAEHGEVVASYSIPAILPLVAIIFVWLAMRAIMKDEALIRSMNRIR